MIHQVQQRPDGRTASAIGDWVLVVDNNELIRRLLSDVLTAERCPVKTAANGAEALTVVERALPRLILLDVQMPVMDGIEFARALRARGLSCPILLMSSDPTASSLAQGIGAHGYLRKPLSLADLRERVRTIWAPGARTAGGHSASG